MEIIEQHKHEAENPRWEEFDQAWKHVHDWRTYVTPEVKDNWGNLSLETRCAVIDVCQCAADQEIWD